MGIDYTHPLLFDVLVLYKAKIDDINIVENCLKDLLNNYIYLINNIIL